MGNWELGILKTFDDLGGEGMLVQIYRKVGDYVLLTQNHHEIQYNRPAYHHQVRSHVSNLVQSGYLERKYRGYYSLTAKGRERLNVHEYL